MGILTVFREGLASTHIQLNEGIKATKLSLWLPSTKNEDNDDNNEQTVALSGKKRKTKSRDRAWNWHSDSYPGSPFSVRELRFLPLSQAQLAGKRTILWFWMWVIYIRSSFPINNRRPHSEFYRKRQHDAKFRHLFVPKLLSLIQLQNTSVWLKLRKLKF